MPYLSFQHLQAYLILKVGFGPMYLYAMTGIQKLTFIAAGQMNVSNRSEKPSTTRPLRREFVPSGSQLFYSIYRA